jgi:hypothetical protein
MPPHPWRPEGHDAVAFAQRHARAAGLLRRRFASGWRSPSAAAARRHPHGASAAGRADRHPRASARDRASSTRGSARRDQSARSGPTPASRRPAISIGRSTAHRPSSVESRIGRPPPSVGSRCVSRLDRRPRPRRIADLCAMNARCRACSRAEPRHVGGRTADGLAARHSRPRRVGADRRRRASRGLTRISSRTSPGCRTSRITCRRRTDVQSLRRGAERSPALAPAGWVRRLKFEGTRPRPRKHRHVVQQLDREICCLRHLGDAELPTLNDDRALTTEETADFE